MYDELQARSTEYIIMLKARAKSNGSTPFDDKAKTLTRIEYVHNIADNEITLILCFDNNDKMYTYIPNSDSELNEDVISVIEAISRQASIDHGQKIKDEFMNELIF